MGFFSEKWRFFLRMILMGFYYRSLLFLKVLLNYCSKGTHRNKSGLKISLSSVESLTNDLWPLFDLYNSDVEWISTFKYCLNCAGIYTVLNLFILWFLIGQLLIDIGGTQSCLQVQIWVAGKSAIEKSHGFFSNFAKNFPT